eukprot:788958-Rhodomonas_salina.2
MAPHNTGSKKLKARRNRLRKRYEEQVAAVVPQLLAIHTSASEATLTCPLPSRRGWQSIGGCGGAIQDGNGQRVRRLGGVAP